MRHTLNDGPIGLLHRPGGEQLAEGGGHAAALGNDDDAGCIAVKPVHQQRAFAQFGAQTHQQAIEMMVRLAAALNGKTRWLIQHQEIAVFVQHHLVKQAALGGGQRLDIGLGRIGGTRVEGQRRHADFLIRFQAGVGFATPCPNAHLAGAGELVQIGESHLREMQLEPAVKAHPRLFGRDGVAFYFGHCVTARTR